MNLLGPKRGTPNTTTGVEDNIPGSPHTLFVQVERTRNDRDGQHLIEYYISHEFSYSDLATCSSTGGISGGAGCTLTLPELPAYARILEVYLEKLTAFVNDAGTQDVDGVAIGATAIMADAEITAGIGLVKVSDFTLAVANSGGDADVVTFVFPMKLAIATAPKIYFAGANGVIYTAGTGILMIKVLSYFDK